MQDYYERYRLSDYSDPSDAILHSIIYEINYKVHFHHHTYYEVFLVFSGGLIHEMGGERQDIPCNSILFIRPEDVHKYYQKEGTPCGLIRLWLSPQIFDTLKAFLGINSGLDNLLAEKLSPRLTITKVDMRSYLEQFEAIFSLSPQEENNRISRLKLILLEITLLFLGHFEKIKSKALPPWIEELCNKMSLKDNFAQGLDRLLRSKCAGRTYLTEPPEVFAENRRRMEPA